MMRSFHYALCLLIAVAPMAASPPSDAELEYGKKKYEVWRQFPDKFAVLRSSANAFAALPKPRQEQLEHFDADLAKLPSADQAKLHNVLDRYNDWLAKLSEEDRDRVLDAPDKAARIAVIKELRQAEWLTRQPKTTRDGFTKIPPDLRPQAIDRARAEERKRQAEWTLAKRLWDDTSKNKQPAKLSDFDFFVQNYVNDVLMKLLSKAEKDRLAAAEGNWPLYPQTLIELADAYPPALPSLEAPKSFADLPKVVKDSHRKQFAIGKALQIEKRIKPFEGRAPEFAIKLTGMASEQQWIMPMEWWAYNFNSLTPAMKEFVEKKLTPALEPQQLRTLLKVEGYWPDYPETIQKFAKEQNLTPPWQSLPGGREKWDHYRPGPRPLAPGYPELPRYKLHDFVFYDLDDLGRTKLGTEIDRLRGKSDGDVWPSIVEQYFQRYPGELTRLRQADRDAARK